MDVEALFSEASAEEVHLARSFSHGRFSPVIYEIITHWMGMPAGHCMKMTMRDSKSMHAIQAAIKRLIEQGHLPGASGVTKVGQSLLVFPDGL